MLLLVLEVHEDGMQVLAVAEVSAPGRDGFPAALIPFQGNGQEEEDKDLDEVSIRPADGAQRQTDNRK